MLVAIFATMYFGKALAPGGDMQGGQGGPGEAMEQPQDQGGTPPSKPDGDTQLQGSTTQPPSIPEGGGYAGSSSKGDSELPQNSQSTPPAKPEGESNSQQGGQGGTPPDMPSGGMPQGGGMQQGEMPQGEIPQGNSEEIGEAGWTKIALYGAESLVIALLVAYLIISQCNKRKFKESFKAGKSKAVFIVVTVAITAVGGCGFAYVSTEIDGLAAPQTGQSSSAEYKAVKTISENTNLDGGSYESTESDTLAVLVMNKINATLKNFELTKTGSSNGGDNTSFYGTNSGITAKDCANLIIEGAKILTDASGANGVFSFGGTAVSGVQTGTGDGTEVTVRDSEITTKQDNSGGVMLTGGGILNVINCVIETFGTSSAALRSDRGGGDFNVEGGTYKT